MRRIMLSLGFLLLAATGAGAGVTVFFNSNQVAELVATGTTWDTISSEGYLFTYTRDKLFTGGVGLTNPVGRFVVVNWPSGVQAQAVTAGPQPGGAQITIARVDGELFDMPAFTFKLLANTAGAGASLEIMPILNGEDGLNNPLYFDATGYYGGQFSYDTTPSYLGSTAALTNYEAYKIKLYVDFAFIALTLDSIAPNMNHAPTDLWASNTSVFENEPAGTLVGTLSTIDPDAGDAFTYALVAGPGSEDNGMFSVSGSNLLAGAMFDFEARSNYSIRVASTDQGLLSTQQVFVIDVLDVDETPVFYAPSIPAEGSVVLQWNSVTNHVYNIYCATDLVSGFAVLQSNIPATPAVNTYTDSVHGVARRFWVITTVP